jgi:hypothetical protein
MVHHLTLTKGRPPMTFKKGTMNPTLLSLVSEKELKASDEIVKGLADVERIGLDVASKVMIEMFEHPNLNVAVLMYAASVLTMFEAEGVNPATVDLFSDLPVRDFSVITIGNEVNKLSPKERAAIYARESLKLIVRSNVDEDELTRGGNAER